MKTILKNVGWLTIGEGVSRILGFFLIVAMTRILGPTEYGKFAFAFAFVSLLAMFSNFGLMGITTRELSQGTEKEKEFPAILSLKLLLSIGTLAVMFLSTFFITHDDSIRKVIWFLSFFALVDNFFWILYAFIRARERMEYEAITKILSAALLFGIGLFVLWHFPSAQNVSYGYLLASFLTLIGLILFFHFRIYPLHLSIDARVWKKFWEFSWPLGLAGISGTVYIYSGSIIMGFLKQVTAVGWYDAAYQIIGIPIIFMTLISTSFYPALSRFAKESKERFQSLWNRQMEAMILLAFPLMTGGMILAPKLINFLYGSSYEPATFALQILLFVAGLNFLYNPYGTALVVSGQQKKHLYGTAIAALINIFLNLLLIPRFSLYGAGVATLISYLVLLLVEAEFVRRFTQINIWSSVLTKVFFASLFASFLMAFVLLQPILFNVQVLVLAVIGALVYFSLLFLFIKLRFLYV